MRLTSVSSGSSLNKISDICKTLEVSEILEALQLSIVVFPAVKKIIMVIIGFSICLCGTPDFSVVLRSRGRLYSLLTMVAKSESLGMNMKHSAYRISASLPQSCDLVGRTLASCPVGRGSNLGRVGPRP